MALTTIDGELCCPKEELAHLLNVYAFEDYALTHGPQYTLEQRAERELGAQNRTRRVDREGGTTVYGYDPMNYTPDRWLAREAAKLVREATDKVYYAQIGEENINGEVWPGPDADATKYDTYWTDAKGKRHYNSYAELSLTGPATLGGKIVLELCRRLRLEIAKDDNAQRYARREQLDQRVLQPEG